VGAAFQVCQDAFSLAAASDQVRSGLACYRCSTCSTCCCTGFVQDWLLLLLLQSLCCVAAAAATTAAATAAALAAGGEVVLCSGTVGNPQLLMLSGIGPADQLTAAGIPVVAESAGVGKNLQDHPATLWAAL
jgi:hypothetical protein